MSINQDWITIIIYFFILLVLVVLSDILNKRYKLSGKITRRIVHIGVGLVVCTTPFTLNSWIQPALLASLFILANLVAIRKGLMQGIHSTRRVSYGTIFFPVSYLTLILLFWKSNPEILIVSMLLLAISDPLAAIVGEKYGENYHAYLYDKKSYHGLMSVFISSFFLSILTLSGLRLMNLFVEISYSGILLASLAVSIIAVPAEAVSFKGTDNLSLPLLSAVMLSIMLNATPLGRIYNLLWVIFAGLVSVIAYKGKSLSRSGVAGAIVIGSFVFTIGGIAWLVPLGVFFVLSSLLSRLGRDHKKALNKIAKKGGQRDIGQVYANGGAGLVLVLIYHFYPSPVLYLMYLGSFAAANADTWETEIGTFFKKGTRNIINFSRVPPGTSGGVSIIGSLGGVVGSGLVALSGIYFISPRMNLLSIFILVTVSGVLGSIIDSYAGALFQAKYLCPVCQTETERLVHCGKNTKHIKGIPWINNDMVNFICTSSGAIIVPILHWIIIGG